MHSTSSITHLSTYDDDVGSGLDDTDATTGFENFENMKSLVKTLNDVARFNGSDNTAKGIISAIDSVAQFHKIGFPRHLGQGE